MSSENMDWKKHYAASVEKNRDWRDLFALISGRKGRPSLDYVTKELKDNKERLIGGLQYFHSQENKSSSNRDNKVFKECGSGWNSKNRTDITAPFLMNKLQSMTGMESGLAWEVLSNYLQYAYRGSPDSLQKLLAQNEEKAQAVVADLFCFYYRERMFILKILYHILTNTTGDFFSRLFIEFIKENINFNELYESLFIQLKWVSECQQPNLSCLSQLCAQRYLTFWMEHSLRERVQLTKLMIISLKNCNKQLPPISRIKEVLELAEECGVRERDSNHCKSDSKVLRRLYVVHIIQLIGFDFLTAEDSRWNEKDMFTSINEKIKLLMDRKAEEGPAFLSTWFIVHQLTPLGVKGQAMQEFIAHTVMSTNPWHYFNSTLTCCDILDDNIIKEIVHYCLYQVAFLSVVNFGLNYVRSDSFCRLVALLVRDEKVLKHFWLTEHDGLQLVLRECESFFPIIWKPVFDIYTSIASHSEHYVNQIEQRVEREVKFTQLQNNVINMECLGNNVFRSLEAVQPFSVSDKIIIPVGTRCEVSGETDIFIHWDFSVSIWHVVKETLFKWSQKITQFPKPPEKEIMLLRENVLSMLAFYNEVLKNRKEQKKIVFFAVDEMFSRIEIYHERKDVEMLEACLKTCTLLLKYYPKDVMMLLEVSRAIPDMDKVVLDHVQCAKGDFYHSNGVKTILELVELNSGNFRVLVSYLEFIYKLFELPTVFESWTALAGLQFVLRDVFPHYNQWIFREERQRIHVEWLCIQIISCVLDVTLPEICRAGKSITKQVDPRGMVCVVPTRNLFANTALHHLLNWEPAIALIHIVSLGDQQLFSWVESFHNWDAECCQDLISSVHSALSILNRCILFKHAHNDQNSLTRLEREIYKEPKETDTYRVVINVAGYVYTFLSPDVRYNSVKLISRFADNRHQSLMACIGIEANTMRQMYLKPLYSSTESEEIKIAVLELVTECIHKQASLAEAFLNALELKGCVEKKAGEESEGFVHISLSIIRRRKETPRDRAYLASVQLLHALWHERRTLVISYIRMRDNFFTNFCYPLFHITELQKQLIPAYAYILTCIGTEMYWYKDNLEATLKKCIDDLFDEDHIIRLSLYCTDQLHGVAPEDMGVNEAIHTADSTKILIAWKEFIYIMAKSFPEKFTNKQKYTICVVHALNALTNEITRQGNMVAISSLAEMYLLLTTVWKLEKVADENLVALKKISAILSQLSYCYKNCSEHVVLNILASCCKFFEYTSFNTKDISSADWDLHMERIIRAICSVLSKELESFLGDRSNKRTRQILPSLLCLAITLGQEEGEGGRWRQLVVQHHIVPQLVEAAAASLQMKELSDSSLLILELLSLLVQDDDWSFRQMDILELHTAWDCLKPPIHKLFGPVPVSIEERSVFEATNWYPVYMRALNLVTALVSHACPSTRELGFDFVYQHEKFICDIFEFKVDSLKEIALDLVSSALRLLWHVIKVVVPWNWKLKSTLERILVKIKQYVGNLVDLLGDSDFLLKRRAMSQNQKTFPPVEVKNKDLHMELQQLQSRLLDTLIECLSVLQLTCPAHADLLTADRLGLPPHRLGLLVEPPPPAETGPEYHTLINLLNLISKKLASNLRMSPRRNGSFSDSTAAATPTTSRKSKPSDENGKNIILLQQSQSVVKEDTQLPSRLAGCHPSELRLVLELTVHYLITNTLLTILSDQMGFHQSVLFLRDLSTEAKTFLEYAQRLRYGKEETVSWQQQPVQVAGYRPLTWGAQDPPSAEDSLSLGCALLPDADSDSESSLSESEKSVKKLIISRVPLGLQHFLPDNLEFDPSFEPRSKQSASGLQTKEDDASQDFILFCNYILKQIFGMHSFDERSLRSGL